MDRIIDSNRPLPSHTIYKWEECFAKIMLEYVFPNDFYDLVISDKPDLQSEKLNIGVEITSAVMKDDFELDRLYSDLEYGLTRNKERVNEKINLLGGSVSEGILMHPIRYRDLSQIEKCICNKMEKLNNSQYKKFASNYLFITDQNLILENECSDLLNNYINIQKNCQVKFQKIFIYLYGGKLYEFDLIRKKFNIYDFSRNEPYEIGMNARKMVEDKEIGLI